MENKRKLIRLDVKDFLEIRPLNDKNEMYRGKGKNITPMGICFSCTVPWRRGQFVYIEYFLSEELDSVKLKVEILWSELISDAEGYFYGGKIIEIEEDKHEKFSNYYSQKLKERQL